MQRAKEYGQNRAPVNVTLHGPLRQRGNQTHRVSVRVGQERVRVSGDFDTIMGWIRLALAERTVKESAA